MDVSNIDEFAHHPDYQQISSFFLGAVFITSLNYSFQWVRGVFPRIKEWISRKRLSTKDVEKNFDKASVLTSLSTIRSKENLSLVFTLSLCFLLASIAFLGSLLSFPLSGGGTCAFLVAWGGVATQTATLVGIFSLLLELRDLGVPNLEYYGSLAALVVEMVLIIVNNSIGTGAVKSLESFDLSNDAICYKKHFLGTAVTVSLIAMFLEIYVLIRFGLILIGRATLASQRPAALNDGRIGKALSLLLLEVLTIGPSAVHITLVADFVPLSIGALIVLWTFNTYKSIREEKDDEMFNPSDPPLFRSTWYSSSSEDSETPPMSAIPGEPMIVHPFSSQYQRERSESSTTTMSTEEGVIQTLERLMPATGMVMTTVARPTQAKLSLSRSRLSSVAEVQVMSPEPARPVSPTSTLMNPWDDKRRRRSSGKTGSEPSRPVSPTSILMDPWHERGDKRKRRSSGKTVRAGEEFSYTVQGLSFPKPPVTSPSDATCRYSSSTLASIANVHEEAEGRRKVHLLTFASPFR